MNQFVYLNGQYVKAQDAKISIFDRSILFGDAVYEVSGVIESRLIDFKEHMMRLSRSLKALSIKKSIEDNKILEASKGLITKNLIKEGLVYIQITRGETDSRDLIWYDRIEPNIFIFTQHKSIEEDENKVKRGLKLTSVPDIRWARRDIKSVNLLGQVLAKYQANETESDEALMIDSDGYVTECSTSSFFIVKHNEIWTRPLSHSILPGVTRSAVINLCHSNNIRLIEKKISLEETFTADEAFITSAASYILPVQKIDEQVIGGGNCYTLTHQLRIKYINYARANAI